MARRLARDVLAIPHHEVSRLDIAGGAHIFYMAGDDSHARGEGVK
jgi:hypothetical protein